MPRVSGALGHLGIVASRLLLGGHGRGSARSRPGLSLPTVLACSTARRSPYDLWKWRAAAAAQCRAAVPLLVVLESLEVLHVVQVVAKVEQQQRADAAPVQGRLDLSQVLKS